MSTYYAIVNWTDVKCFILTLSSSSLAPWTNGNTTFLVLSYSGRVVWWPFVNEFWAETLFVTAISIEGGKGSMDLFSGHDNTDTEHSVCSSMALSHAHLLLTWEMMDCVPLRPWERVGVFKRGAGPLEAGCRNSCVLHLTQCCDESW